MPMLLTITADVFLRNGFKAEGEVNLLRASIGGNLRCTGGHFLNKEGKVINAESATIGGSVFLGGKWNDISFQAESKVIFLNATIDDRFELMDIGSSDAELVKLMSLDLRFAQVNTFSFENEGAENLWIKKMKQGQLCLNGFSYKTLNVNNNAIQDQRLLKWLHCK